jgi:hypothetical protein
MATTHAPNGETAVPAHRGGQDGGQAQDDYPLRQAELRTLLERVEEKLDRCGLAPRRENAQDPTDRPAGAEGALDDEQRAWRQRRQAREIASVMFSELGTRLDTLMRTFAQLSEQERLGLAALLRLTETRRSAIGTLLRLPSRQRRELGIAFRRSEAECRALAALLDPQAPVDAPKPSVRIVDAAVADESAPGDEHARTVGDPVGAA